MNDIGNPLLEGDEDPQEDTDRDQSEPTPQLEDVLGDEQKKAAVQQMLFSAADEPNNPIELYRRDWMIEVLQKDWHMALLIFQELGWQPVRHLAGSSPVSIAFRSRGYLTFRRSPESTEARSRISVRLSGV